VLSELLVPIVKIQAEGQIEMLRQDMNNNFNFRPF
jgi:hypothetical protein